MHLSRRVLADIMIRWTLPLARRGMISFHTPEPLLSARRQAVVIGVAQSAPSLRYTLCSHDVNQRLITTNNSSITDYHKYSIVNSSPISSAAMIYRDFHSTPTLHGQKKRRVSASSARKKKQLQLTKQQQAKKKQAKMKKKKNQKHHQQQLPHKPGMIPDPIEKKQKQQQREVPKAFCVQTASSYAYIAKCAVMDEFSGEVYVDPKSLFSELNNNNKQSASSGKAKQGGSSNKNNQQQKKRSSHQQLKLPRIFRNSHLEYFSPSSFPNHEPPRDGTPEVAFLGRSNTGKSSLINALSSLIQRGAKGGSSGATFNSASGGGELARTSKQPGRTQTINYFGLVPNDDSNFSADNPELTFGKKNKKQNANTSKLYLVDLPGFGYAAAPDESVDEWQRKTQEFLVARASMEENGGEHRNSIQPWPDHRQSNSKQQNNQLIHYGKHHGNSPPLKRLYLLLDSRLPDPALLDLSVMSWCDEYAIPYTIVLTKVDGSSRAQCVKLTNQLCMRYHSLYADTGSNDGTDEDVEEGEVYMDPVVYWTSSKDGLGMEELLLSVENNMFSVDDDDGVYDEEDEEGYDVDSDDEDELIPGGAQ